jgi:hypothetical protein
MFYVIIDATNPANLKWSAYAEKLTPFNRGAAERTVELGLSTLCTYCEYNDATQAYERRHYVGTRQPGSFRNNKGTLIENDFGLRLFYIKKLQTAAGGPTYPVSFNHNTDAANNVIEKYSLALDNAAGIAPNLHQSFEDIMDRIETVKVTANANTKMLAEMDGANTVEIDNILYLPFKRYRSIPLKNDTDKTAEIGLDLVVL